LIDWKLYRPDALPRLANQQGQLKALAIFCIYVPAQIAELEMVIHGLLAVL